MYKLRDKQAELVNILLEESYDRLLVYASPRVGKTLTILDYIKKCKFKKVLWLGVNSYFRDTAFDEELSKFKLGRLRKYITVICVDSLKNYVGDYDLIVYDECHTITLDIYKLLFRCKYKKLILMTGTIPNKRDKLTLLNKLDTKVVFKYTPDDAVEDDDIADYSINIIHHKMDHLKNIRVDYVRQGQSFNFYTSEVGQYNSVSAKIDKLDGEAKKRMSLYRMRLCNEFPSRIKFIKKYLEANKHKRMLIFVSSRAMAEQFDYFYHGTSSDEHYKAFEEEKIPYLVLVEKGGTGHTYENLDGCLLASINSSNVIAIQKLLRSVVFREGYIANMDVLVNADSIQIKWIGEALASLNQEKIQHIK